VTVQPQRMSALLEERRRRAALERYLLRLCCVLVAVLCLAAYLIPRAL